MLIGNRKIDEKIIKSLLEKIKKKKDLAPLTDDFVRETLKRYLHQQPLSVTFLITKFSPETEKYKKIIKGVRRELRRSYGLYKIKKDFSVEELLKELINTKSPKKVLTLHKKILETHSSSKERLSFYPNLYSKLFKLTGKPLILLDLGCGLNPFSFPFMKIKGPFYYLASDISSQEITLIRKYFQFLKENFPGFSGKTSLLDLRNIKKLKNLKKSFPSSKKGSVCFLWKIVEILDKGKGHKLSEKIIVSVPTSFVVLSFPTQTVKGLPMKKPQRKWVELMCQRLSFSFKLIKEKNEIFYVIKK